jgi:transcription termination factor Rho
MPLNGFLDLSTGANGRIRMLDKTLIADPKDPVVPAHMVEQLKLRPGAQLEFELGKPFHGGNGQRQNNQQQGGRGRNKKRGRRKKPSDIGPDARLVKQITQIDGEDPKKYAETRKFEDLTTVDPHPRLTLEYPDCPPACRLIDLFCPIGYGTRGMIVSPPKAGKTTLLQNIAFAIEKNHPDCIVQALLIDERPEEVTDFRRNVPCEVLASSNDHDAKRHVGLSILAIERAKRMAEQGKNAVILLDSLTRIGRAFNNAPGMAQTGRTMSGGLDSGALAIPKQLFGAARRFEEGGSLTIIATVLTDTGSRGDQVIFEEFKGTGNMELILDREIANRRLFPAINLAASGTRKEHLLLDEAELTTMTALRRRLLNMPSHQQVEQLLAALQRFKTNADVVGSPQSPSRA